MADILFDFTTIVYSTHCHSDFYDKNKELL